MFYIFNAKKIFPQYHYIPIYKFTAFKGKEKRLPGAENFYKSSLSLPIYYEMNFKDCDKVIKCIEIAIKKFKWFQIFKILKKELLNDREIF